ncbi:MAG TPA: hypothetical protein IAA30_05820 [Candidatus Treponema faecavium]|nr:hypothetical protein [Candidatus Treponema faecavium]
MGFGQVKNRIMAAAFAAAAFVCAPYAGADAGVSAAGGAGAQGGALYADGAGSIWWWQPRAHVSLKNAHGAFLAEAHGGQVRARHAYIDAVISGGGARLTGSNEWFSLGVSIGTACHGEARAVIPGGAPLVDGDARVSSSGGSVFLYGLDAAVSFARIPLTVRAGARLGMGGWGPGDFYYFFGYPELPLYGAYSVSAVWSDMAELRFAGFHGGLRLYSNEERAELARAQVNGYAVQARTGVDLGRHRLSFSAGFVYAEVAGALGLTSQNQKYMFFPYKYVNAEGRFGAWLLHAGAAWQSESARGVHALDVRAGAAVCVYDRVSYALSYLEKDNLFFDGESGEFSGDRRLLQGSALVYGYVGYRLQPAEWVSITLRKLFAVPLLSKQLAPQGGVGGADGGLDAGQLIKTALLSGLTLGLTIHW